MFETTKTIFLLVCTVVGMLWIFVLLISFLLVMLATVLNARESRQIRREEERIRRDGRQVVQIAKRTHRETQQFFDGIEGYQRDFHS